MNWLQAFLIRRRARQDAAVRQEAAEEQITAALGPRPQFDPVGNFQHARVGRDLERRVEIEELGDDLRRVEDALTLHPSSRALFWALVVLFVCETLGSVLVMKSIGVENPQRVVLGSMLAAILFFLTWWIARLGSVTPSTPVEVAPAAQGRVRWVFYGILAIYGVLVGALAVLRLEESSVGEDGSLLADLAEGVVMVFCSVGPAALFELLLRRRAPVARLMKERRILLKRIRRAEWARLVAQEFLEKLERRREGWEREAAQRRAVYEIEYRRTRARLPGAAERPPAPAGEPRRLPAKVEE